MRIKPSEIKQAQRFGRHEPETMDESAALARVTPPHTNHDGRPSVRVEPAHEAIASLAELWRRLAQDHEREEAHDEHGR